MRGSRGRSSFCIGQFVVFLPFHPPVLEPDFDLSFGKAQTVSNLYPPTSGQVPVKMELFFQFQNLLPGVCCPGSLGFPSGVIGVDYIYNIQEKKIRRIIKITFANNSCTKMELKNEKKQNKTKPHGQRPIKIYDECNDFPGP